MKQYRMKWFAFCLSVSVCLSMVGCTSMFKDDAPPSADCIINGREFYFVSDETKQEWKAPLAKLLSNVLVPYGELGDILGYEATVDSNAPAIPQSFKCGLMDVTMDGIPELLVHPFGYFGSSGIETYFVYNIYSGQKLGEMGGGNAQSWCFYYDTESDALDLVGQYWLRGGFSWRDRYVTEMIYDDERMECVESKYLSTSHEIFGEQTDIVDEDPDDMFYTATWVETYPNTTYYINDQEVYLDDYYAAYDHFVQTSVRIPETELILIRWEEISNEDDDASQKGAKMAEALVNSKQEFILP